MSNLQLNIPHKLTQEEARDRIQSMLGKLKAEQKGMIDNVTEEWTGNSGRFSFSAKGFDLAGSITVLPGSVDIDAKLPFAVSIFKGKISQVITDKANELLAK